MARTRNLGQLRNDIRVRADMVNDSLCADADVNEWANQGWADLYEKIVQGGENYYLSTNLFSTMGGTASYALPADHYATRGVDAQVNGSQWFNLHRFQFERRNDYSLVDGSWNTMSCAYYDLQGGNLVFIPTPGAVYAIRHWYVPIPVRMVADSDSIDGVAGWEQYVIDWAAKKCLERDKDIEAAQAIAADIAALEARIMASVGKRIIGEAPKMRIVRGRPWVPGQYGRWWQGGRP